MRPSSKITVADRLRRLAASTERQSLTRSATGPGSPRPSPPRALRARSGLKIHTAALLSAALICGCSKAPQPPPPEPPPEHVFEETAPVRTWLVCGPWPVAAAPALAREALATDFLTGAGGEVNADPPPGFDCRWGGETRTVRAVHADAEGLDLATQTAGSDGVLYLAARIRSSAPRHAFFHLETREPVRAWCNGRQVLLNPERADAPAFHAFDAMVESGINRLLLKVVVGPAPGPLRLLVSDEANHRHTLAAMALRRMAAPPLQLDVEQSGDFAERVRLRARPTFETLGVFDSQGATWQVSSIDGHIEWQGTGPLGEQVEAVLPAAAGFHRIHLEAPGVLAEPCVAEREIVTSTNAAALCSGAIARAEAIAADPARFRYAGRLLEALGPLKASGTNDPAGLRLLLERLQEADGDSLPSSRGLVEWAVRSSVDGSGQPFRVRVPEDYHADYRYPVHVRLTPATGEPDDASLAELWRGAFVLWPGHRATSSGLRGAGASDVLDATALIEKAWSIDERRVYLSGDGVLGEAAWRLAARFPDRFGALRIAGSRAPDSLFENLGRVPVFSTRSENDPETPWWLSRVPLDALSRIGGYAVTHDLADAGHDLARAGQELGTGIHWERAQRAPVPADYIQLTAGDGGARRSHWVEIVEWEDGGRPARLLVRAGRDNTVFLDADNASVVRMDLAHAPLDTRRPVRITVNGRRRGIADPPFTDAQYFSISGEFLRATGAPPSPGNVRPYRPSDTDLAAERQPLLIVRGTAGPPEMTDALLLAAEQLRRMPAPAPGGRPGSGTPRWPVKTDAEVTAEDLNGFDLIVLGGPPHNTLAARMAENLPVHQDNGRLCGPDGASHPADRRAWRLHYYNPLAKKREIFLFACPEPVFFAAGMPGPPAGGGRSPQPDFMLWSLDGGALAAAGFFGAGWEWNPAGARAQPLPAALCSRRAWAEFQAAAMLKAAAADIAVLPPQDDETTAPLFVAGEAAWADALACAPDTPLWRFTVPIPEIARLQNLMRVAMVGKTGGEVRLFPGMNASEDSRGLCRVVACGAKLATAFLRTGQPRVETAEFAGDGLREAVRWRFVSQILQAPARPGPDAGR